MTSRSRRRSWFRLRWPNEITQDHLTAALSSLNGSSTPRRRGTLVFVACGADGEVTHYVSVSEARASGARRQMEAAIPGLTVEPCQAPTLVVQRCWRAWMSNRTRPLDSAHPEAMARGLLTALASAEHDELLVLRWVLGPVHRPVAVPTPTKRQDDNGLGLPSWVTELRGQQRLDDPEARTALAQKQGRSGWRAALHLGVVAKGRRRQRQLLGQVAGVLRVGDAPGVQLGFKRATRSVLARKPILRPGLVNVEELIGLAGWPLGLTEDLPVRHERSRLLRPSRALTPAGRVVVEATYPGAQQQLCLSAADALHHALILGPTGVGKTTLLLNLISQDMAAGRSVVVIEPRGDLVASVLARVPDDRLDDVVVIDPSDAAPVGINPLATPGVPAELKVEHLLAVFKGIWADSWGPRLEDHLVAGLLTLAAAPKMSLAALPALFTNEQLRASIVDHVRDDLVLGDFWDEFEEHPPPRRATILAPVMNKVRAFLLRESLRRVVGQTQPRFDLRDIYRKRPIVLVNLATGVIGPESSALLGSLLLSHLWLTIQGRAAVPTEQRHPVMVFADEWQRYLHLSTDLAEVLNEARGLGVGLTLAHQHLAQLTGPVKAAALANARSKVVFATNHDDAHTLVRNSTRLAPSDVVDLGRFAVYASLLSNGETTPWASGQTLPAPPQVRDPDDVREHSRRRWGIPAGVIDAELRLLTTGKQAPAQPDDEETFGAIPAPVDQEPSL